MEYRDPYDPTIVFDDVYGDATYYGIVTGGRSDPVYAAKEIIRRVHSRRLASQPMIVSGAEYDPTYRTFEVVDVVYRVIGDESTSLPVFDSLRRRFSSALPASKHVRLDDEASYIDFRAARRAPYVDKLEARLSALETAVALHIADDHGGGRVAALEEAFAKHVGLGEAAMIACGEAVCGGERVPLPLPKWSQGKIECWRDGEEILCTVRVLAPDGTARLATTGEPISRRIDEVIDAAIDVDAEPEDVAMVGPALAQVLGADALVTQLCGVVPELLARKQGAPLIGVMSSACVSSVAAAMALLQRCQRGDRQACAEASEMSRLCADILADAGDRLLRGQSDKARRVLR